ncbi:hypothetical protein WME90_11115 [Sorangium sp. So ce375]|uniref:hypothetical protein n=1 Tax=Sorangium sp. So ce375 TaxID=3133306 RepID=UPI003F5C3288
MTRERDLLALLREVDERLAAAPPSPRAAARLGARLRGARPSLARPLGRPLVLAIAAATAAVALGAALQRPTLSDVSARGAAVDPAVGIVGDRPLADGGSPESPPADGHPPATPRIFAPLLREPSRRLAPPPRTSPPAPRSSEAPPPTTSPPAPHSSSAPPDARDAPVRERRSELPKDRLPAPPPRAHIQPPAVALPSSPGWVDVPERPPLHASRGGLPSLRRGSAGEGVLEEAAGQKGERSDESSAEGPDGATTAEPNGETASPQGAQEESGCRTAEELTSEVEAMCDAKGLVVGDVRLLDPCRGGGYGRIEHTCVDGEPTECWSGQLGDGLTCHDSIDLKDQAYITCRNRGGDLAGLDYDPDSSGCAVGETTGAVYACCPAAEPLPSPMCWTSKVDHGGSCQTLPALDDEVSALCASTDQTLFHIGYGFGNALCPGGEAASALFTCCP